MAAEQAPPEEQVPPSAANEASAVAATTAYESHDVHGDFEKLRAEQGLAAMPEDQVAATAATPLDAASQATYDKYFGNDQTNDNSMWNQIAANDVAGFDRVSKRNAYTFDRIRRNVGLSGQNQADAAATTEVAEEAAGAAGFDEVSRRSNERFAQIRQDLGLSAQVAAPAESKPEVHPVANTSGVASIEVGNTRAADREEASDGGFPGTFAEQRADVRTVKNSAGEEVKYTVYEPAIPESPVPIVVVAGFGTTMESTTQAARIMRQEGRRIILIDQPMASKAGEETPIHPDIDRYHNANAENILCVVDEVAGSGGEQVDLVGQSRAAFDVTAAALMAPEGKIRSIVLENGGGLIGRDTSLRLVGRFALDMMSKAGRSMYLPKSRAQIPQSNAYNKGFIKRIATHPLDAAREIRAIARSRIDNALMVVRQRGTKVGVIEGNADRVFAPRRMDSYVRVDSPYGEIMHNVDEYAALSDRNAPHGPLLFSELGPQAAVSMIRSLNHEHKAQTERQALRDEDDRYALAA